VYASCATDRALDGRSLLHACLTGESACEDLCGPAPTAKPACLLQAHLLLHTLSRSSMCWAPGHAGLCSILSPRAQLQCCLIQPAALSRACVAAQQAATLMQSTALD